MLSHLLVKDLGKVCRKTRYLTVKTQVSCREFPLNQPTESEK